MEQLENLKLTLEKDGEIIVEVKAVPGSSRTEIKGFLDQALKIKIVAAPEKGKANEEIIQVLAQTFHVKPASIQLLQGQTSPRKKFRITLEK